MRRAFRVLQLAVGTSDLADGMFRVLVPLIGLSIDRSVTAVTLVSLAVRLPGPLVVVPAGHLLDRVGHHARISTAAALLRVVCLAVLGGLYLASLHSVTALCIVAFLVIAASNVNDLAVQSNLPSFVEPEKLGVANSWIYSAQVLLVQMVGPGIVGVVLVWGSVTTLGIIAVLAALSALTFVFVDRVSGSRAAQVRSNRNRGSFFHGFRYIRNDAILRRLCALAALNNLCYAMIFTFLPAWVVYPGPIGQSAGTYGWIVSAMAIGSLAGGIANGKIGSKVADHHVTRFGFIGIAASFSLVLIPSLPLLVVSLAGYGFVSIVWSVRAVSFRQAAVPQGEFGRVNAAFRWFSLVTPACGAVLAGVLNPWLGIRGTFALAVGILACGAVFALARPVHTFNELAEV